MGAVGKTVRRLGAFALVAGTLWACKDEIPDREIPLFNQPNAVAVACYDASDGPQPLDACRDVNRTTAHVIGFVTQARMGEVAVVDLSQQSSQALIDQEYRIPFGTFVPAGGRPMDVAVTGSGQWGVTANWETEDLTVFSVTDAVQGEAFLKTRSIALDGSPARLVVPQVRLRTGDVRDDIALVSLPVDGDLAVVALREFSMPQGDGEVAVPSGVLGRVHLAGPASGAEADGSIAPWAMALSDRGTVYVAGSAPAADGASYVVEIPVDILVDRALDAWMASQNTARVAAPSVVLRWMDISPFTVRDMALEPELNRWAYLVENETGGVVVLDGETGELLPVNTWNENAGNAFSIDIPGMARSVSMVRLDEAVEEGAVPTVTTFDGTFALVASSNGGLYVVDVAVDPEFADLVPEYTVYPHALHSSTQWYDVYNYGDDEAADHPLLPEAGAVSVFVDDKKVDVITDLFVPMEAADVGDCTDAAHRYRDHVSEDAAVYFRCDRRMSTQETWALDYEGELGISGVAIVEEEGEDQVVVRDPFLDFCAAGVIGAAGEDLWGRYPADADAGDFEGYRDYRGDVLEITSDPTPWQDADCSAYEDDAQLRYRIVEARPDAVVLQPMPDGAPLPTRRCFGQAFSYTVRAGEAFAVRGSQSGVLLRGSEQDGVCVPWDAQNDRTGRNARAFWGHRFRNTYLSFTLPEEYPWPEGRRPNEVDRFTLTFETYNGFVPMRISLGGTLSDIAVSPDGTIYVADEGGAQLFPVYLGAATPVADSIR